MVSGGGKRAQDRRRREPQAALRRAQLPATRTLVWRSSLRAEKSRHAELLSGHAVAQQLEVVVPGAAGVAFAQTLKWETSFFYEVTAPLAQLLSRRFVQEYVLQGTVTMVAKNVPVDAANSAMLLPSGELLLLVDADTYAQLGLVGRKYGAGSAVRAACRPTAADRYVITIDLTSKAFAGAADAEADGDANRVRDRVLRCLETSFAPLEMLVCAYNERGAPRTLLFGDDDTVERKRVEVNGAVTHFQDVMLPQLQVFGSSSSSATSDDSAARAAEIQSRDALLSSLQEAYDWLGLVACRLTGLLQHKSPEPYVSTFTGPRDDAFPFASGSELAAVRWRGLLATDFRQSVVDKAVHAVKSRLVPWVVVMVWGFPDALVSWTQKKKKEKRGPGVHCEHGFLVSGSNHYTLLLLPNDEYILLQALGPHDATV